MRCKFRKYLFQWRSDFSMEGAKKIKTPRLHVNVCLTFKWINLNEMHEYNSRLWQKCKINDKEHSPYIRVYIIILKDEKTTRPSLLYQCNQKDYQGIIKWILFDVYRASNRNRRCALKLKITQWLIIIFLQLFNGKCKTVKLTIYHF